MMLAPVFLQTSTPIITGPQVAMWVGIVGLFIVLFKLGAVWGDLNRNVVETRKQNAKDGADLREEVRAGFARLDTALTKFSDAMTGLSALVTALSVTVQHHDKMLNRSLTGSSE